MECGNKTYVDGRLNDDCIECKVASGLVPGLQTGLDVWMDEGFGGSGAGSIHGSLDGHETLENSVIGSTRTSVNMGGSQEKEDNAERRLRSALGRGGIRMESSGKLTRDQANGDNGMQEQRQRSEPVKMEGDEESWMWGDMKAFGGDVKQ